MSISVSSHSTNNHSIIVAITVSCISLFTMVTAIITIVYLTRCKRRLQYEAHSAFENRIFQVIKLLLCRCTIAWDNYVDFISLHFSEIFWNLYEILKKVTFFLELKKHIGPSGHQNVVLWYLFYQSTSASAGLICLRKDINVVGKGGNAVNAFPRAFFFPFP